MRWRQIAAVTTLLAVAVFLGAASKMLFVCHEYGPLPWVFLASAALGLFVVWKTWKERT